MNRFLKTIQVAGVAVVAVAGLASSASAHRIWLLPSTFTLSGDDQWVTVDGAISNNLFFPNHVAMSLGNVSVTQPDGETGEIKNGARGKYRSTFDIQLDKQGTYKIAENAATYFVRWSEGGQEKASRGSFASLIERGLAAKPGAKMMTAQRRVESFVTLGAPTKTVFTPTGAGMELVPVTHPNDVYTGEEATFRLMLDGKPAAGVEVLIVKGNDRYRDAGGETKVTTNADGRFSFTPNEAGRYWMSGYTLAGETEEQGYRMARRVSYTMTFEALPN